MAKEKWGASKYGMSERTSKRGWRSGRPGAMFRDKATKERDRIEAENMHKGLVSNFPWRIEKMSNGAWQFFWMSHLSLWFHGDVPQPAEGQAQQWAEDHGIVVIHDSIQCSADTIEAINQKYPHWTVREDD